jgi:hypothetical protein
MQTPDRIGRTVLRPIVPLPIGISPGEPAGGGLLSVPLTLVRVAVTFPAPSNVNIPMVPLGNGEYEQHSVGIVQGAAGRGSGDPVTTSPLSAWRTKLVAPPGP